MSRWPPAVWLCIFCGSLLVLIGVGGEWNPESFVPGALLMLAGLGLSIHFAYGQRRKPSARGVAWLVPATALFYIAAAVAAALAGGKYVIAALGASVVPLTAAALIVATAREKTAGDAGADHRDPFPGIGVDDATPLGDTSEHSDADRNRPSDLHPQHGRPAR
jgi:peptidoglycan/LPS O-acetylase OafA/YrhL